MPTNPFESVMQFELAMCEFTGAPFAVAVDSCTSAIFLAAKYCHQQRTLSEQQKGGMNSLMPSYPIVFVPKKTFISVPTAMLQAGWGVLFKDVTWEGSYRINPLPIWDSALQLRRGMWSSIVSALPSAFVCLSFQYRKHLPIGRGGMILHNDPEADVWLRKARFYGREACDLEHDSGPTFLGWRKYMTPDEASRGLCFLHHFEDNAPDLQIDYPDLSQLPVFKSGLQKLGEDQP